MSNLPRKWILMDEKGRITIPDYMRKAFGLPEGENYPLIIEAYPSLNDCKTLFIKREDEWKP
jgi:bifunctional DNA-binding transcriptional regulator/antitoxin component of YhaV-PrlF toxin-antitoxin module